MLAFERSEKNCFRDVRNVCGEPTNSRPYLLSALQLRKRLGSGVAGPMPSALTKNDPFVLSRSDPPEEAPSARIRVGFNKAKVIIIHAEGVQGRY